MRIRNLLSLTGLVGIVVLGIAYLSALGVRVGLPDERSTVVMTMADTNGLVVGSSVLLRGVPVGAVSGLAPSAAGAEVTFYLEQGHRVPVDTEIRLDNLSALGETFVSLTPRTAGGPVLRDGQRVGTEQVVAQPSIAELSTRVVHLLAQTDPDQLARVIEEIDVALPSTTEGTPAARETLDNLSRVSAVLATAITSIPGRGSELLSNMQALLRNADFVGPAIGRAGPDFADVGPAYNALITASFRILRETGAPESIVDFGKYLARIQGFLDESAPDLATIGRALLPNVDRINRAARTVDTAQLLDSALASVGTDGITLRLAVPRP